MKFTKLLTAALTLGITSFIGMSGINSAQAASLSHAPSMLKAETKEVVEVPEGETKMDNADMLTTLITSTTTELSQAYKVSFSAKIDAYSNRLKNVFIAIDDPNYDPNADYPVIEKVENEETGEMEYKEPLPIFNGYVFLIKGTTASKNAVIPQRLNFADKFYLVPTSINTLVVSDNRGWPTKDAQDYSKLESILIPHTIIDIADHAFVNVPDDLKFNIEHATAPGGYSETSFDGGVIEYGYKPTPAETLTMLETKKFGNISFGSGKKYFLGYHDYDEDGNPTKYHKPLIAEFDVYNDKDYTDLKEHRVEVVPVTPGRKYNYDGIGGIPGCENTLTRDVEFRIQRGEFIKDDTLRFHNVFEAEKYDVDIVVDGKPSKKAAYRPDLEKDSYYIEPNINFKAKHDITEFVTIESNNASRFLGFTQFNINFDRVNDIYEKLNPSLYEQHKKAIDSGDVIIRYQLSSLSLTKYNIWYESDGEVKNVQYKINPPTGYDFTLLNNEHNVVGFIIQEHDVAPDFAFEKIQDMHLSGLTIKLDLYSKSIDNILVRSSVETRFGDTTMFTVPRAELPFNNLDTVLYIALASYIGLFAVGAVVVYFIKKEKYKNDEFLRMNTKKYTLKALKNFAGYFIVFLSIIFIVFRWGFMDTSVVAFNPLDVYVICFTVIGLIFIGFAIKELVVSIKTNNEKKKRDKLKLNADVADDGTN